MYEEAKAAKKTLSCTLTQDLSGEENENNTMKWLIVAFFREH